MTAKAANSLRTVSSDPWRCTSPAAAASLKSSWPTESAKNVGAHRGLVRVISGLLEGKRSDRERRARSLVALTAGAVTIARAMRTGGAWQDAALRSALATATLLVDKTIAVL